MTVFDPGANLQAALDLGIDVAIFVLIVLVGILLGYVIGYAIAAIIKKILNIRELKEWIAGSEILSLNFWNKLVSGIGVYIRWLMVSVVLNFIVWSFIDRGLLYVNLSSITEVLQSTMVGLGIFLLFAVVGVVVGAILYKIIKASLDSIRIEETMAKHGMSDALGGLQLTKVIAGIFMVYVVIIFLATGIDAVARPLGQDQNALVLMFNNPDSTSNSLVELYPQFVLGGFIIIAGAIIGDFAQDRIKKSKSSLATDTVAWLVQAMIIFFAVVIALPHFQIRENVSILTDSFKIIVAGVSIGLAIAMGLGLKDMFANIGKKYEKKI
jgi:hypothetical protein